jgi:hypothetical protein
MWVLELSLSQDWWQWEASPIMLPSFAKSKLGNIKISKDSTRKKEDHKNKREKHDKFLIT